MFRYLAMTGGHGDQWFELAINIWHISFFCEGLSPVILAPAVTLDVDDYFKSGST